MKILIKKEMLFTVTLGDLPPIQLDAKHFKALVDTAQAVFDSQSNVTIGFEDNEPEPTVTKKIGMEAAKVEDAASRKK